ncbi:MAG: hypothetical protein ABI612_25225 [Betaproteobacteria bacterium]
MQFVGPVDMQGTGLGNVATLLTMQHKGNATTENGSVFAIGAGQDTSGTNVVGQNHLRTFSELNVKNASGIRIFFNPSEPQNSNEGITLNTLELAIFAGQY